MLLFSELFALARHTIFNLIFLRGVWKRIYAMKSLFQLFAKLPAIHTRKCLRLWAVLDKLEKCSFLRCWKSCWECRRLNFLCGLMSISKGKKQTTWDFQKVHKTFRQSYYGKLMKKLLLSSSGLECFSIYSATFFLLFISRGFSKTSQ